MKILIVDDSKAMRMIIIRTLKQSGIPEFTVIEACNGVEALAMVPDHKPDLVLSDWNMPEMKGLELLSKLRESGNHVRFGFITSESNNDVRRIAQETGADFLVTKPFTPNSLAVAINPPQA